MFKGGFGVATPYSAGPSRPRNYGQQGGVNLQDIGSVLPENTQGGIGGTNTSVDDKGNVTIYGGTPNIAGADKQDWEGTGPTYNWKGDIYLLQQANPHRLKHRPTFEHEDLGHQRGTGRRVDKSYGRYKCTMKMWIDEKEIKVEAASWKKKQSIREASCLMLQALKDWDPPLARMGTDNSGNFQRSGGLLAKLNYTDEKLGLGFDYSDKGWKVTQIHDKSQPSLMVGDLIIEIGNGPEKVSLVGLSQEDQVAIFKAELKHHCEVKLYRDPSMLAKFHHENRQAAVIMGVDQKRGGGPAHSVLWRWWKRNRMFCGPPPRYQFVGHEGQVHERINIFSCTLTYKGVQVVARAARPKKRDAEKSSANAMVCKLQSLGIEVDPHGSVMPEESTDMGDIAARNEDPVEIMNMLKITPSRIELGNRIDFKEKTEVEALNPSDKSWITGGRVSQRLPDGKYKIFWVKWGAYSDHPAEQVRSQTNFKRQAESKAGERLWIIYLSYDPNAQKDEFYSESKNKWEIEKLVEFVKMEKAKHTTIDESAAGTAGGGKYSLAGTGILDGVGVKADAEDDEIDIRDIMSGQVGDRNKWAATLDIEVPAPDRNGRIRCEVCELWLNGPSPYKNHVLGRKHAWLLQKSQRRKQESERRYGRGGFGHSAYGSLAEGEQVMDLSGDAKFRGLAGAIGGPNQGQMGMGAPPPKEGGMGMGAPPPKRGMGMGAPPPKQMGMGAPPPRGGGRPGFGGGGGMGMGPPPGRGRGGQRPDRRRGGW